MGKVDKVLERIHSCESQLVFAKLALDEEQLGEAAKYLSIAKAQVAISIDDVNEIRDGGL